MILLLIGLDRLKDFFAKYTNAKSQLESWISETEDAQWSSPHDVTERYKRCSILSDNRIVFRIKGNDYRLLVKVNYKKQIVLIMKVGTHKEYDNWNL